MLNKDLLRYNVRSGEIKPKFIKAETPDLIELSQQLLALYDPELELTRGEIEQMSTPLVNSIKDLKLAKGLNKLILDKCEFSIASKTDYSSLRANIFSTSNNILRASEEVDLEKYRNRVISELNKLEGGEEGDIYADLPDNERLIKVKEMSPKELLERYNVSLVQSLLLHSNKLTLTFEEADPAMMRALFRYLRFFRLLADLKKTQCSRYGIPKKVVMEIDGPASLFENTQKYALQLASFFPAICLMTKWKIETVVKIGKKELTLKLSNRSNLKSHYRGASYTPEEVKLFQNLFKEKVKEWDILEESSFLDLGDQNLVFPDQSYKNENGDVIHLELFHRWHSHQMIERLEYLEENQQLPLIIGVDRAIYNKPEFKERLNASEYFQNNGFLFRDFPGVDRVKKCLNNKLKSLNKSGLL